MRFPRVDSIRGIAALGVLLCHVSITPGLGIPDWIPRIGSRFEVGVPVFFAVSGFVLYRPFALAHSREASSPAIPAYAWRRLLRIVPAYFVAIAVIALTVDSGKPGSTVLSALTFTQQYSDEMRNAGTALIPQAWTLCVEIAFYLLLPAYALMVRRSSAGWLGREIRGLGMLVAVAIVWKAMLTAANPEAMTDVSGIWLPGHLDHFALGIGLAVVSVRVGDGPPPGWALAVARWGFAAAGLAVVVAVLLLPPIGIHSVITPGGAAARHVLYGLVAVGLLGPAVIEGDRLAQRVLERPLLLWLGAISYGIYLWHWFVIDLVAEVPAPPLVPAVVWLAGLSITGTVAIAALSHRLVEQPAMQLRRLVPARREGSELSAAAAA